MRHVAMICSIAFAPWLASNAIAQNDAGIFGDGYERVCPGASPSVTIGTGSALLLRGTIVTPTVAFIGEVLVAGDSIACVAASCAAHPSADTASVVETNGLVYPGLIDAASSVLFGVFDEQDWAPPIVYTNSTQWPNHARWSALLDAKQYLNGEGQNTLDLGCELDKYGELKGLVAGATSIVGHANPANKPCYGSLARTIDQVPNDLGADRIQAATLFPSRASADVVCANFANGSTHAYIVHIAEGTDSTARDEFARLGTVTTSVGCLYAPQTAIVHGTALEDTQLSTMATAGMSLIWTPKSDVTLYGDTADIPNARAKGINVALGTNGSITGSGNLLEALRAADAFDDAQSGNVLSHFDLVQMVTINAARALHLESQLGSIEVGKKADLTVVAGQCSAPWSALVKARPNAIRLVLVGGKPLYGDATMQAIAPTDPGCEALDVCGTAKFACVAEAGGIAANKFGQTYAQIAGLLSSALADYDAASFSAFDFAPIAPLVRCR